MTKRSALGLLLLSAVLVGAATNDYSRYTESTTIDGRLPVDLRGVWFVVAQPRVGDGKFKTLPQLIAVSQGSSGLTLHLMDVRLPKEMVQAVRAANDKLERWTPSDKDVALLRQQWSKLPPATDKDVMAGDLAYSQVRFSLASPERYADAFPKQDDALRDVLADSGFTLEVDESYRSLPIPPGKNVGQLMVRKTIYGVRSASDTVLEGKLVTGLLAATPFTPIPYNFGGSFTMYRLASSSATKSAPKPPSRSQPAPRSHRRARAAALDAPRRPPNPPLGLIPRADTW